MMTARQASVRHRRGLVVASGAARDMMITLDEALRIVLGAARPIGAERVAMDRSLHRILAEDVISDGDIPPSDRAIMDGFACRRADTGRPLTIIETIPAGATPRKTVGPGQCARIMTGSVLPEGADCVVMVEHADRTGEHTIQCRTTEPLDYIRRRAQDLKAGQIILDKGIRIGPQHIAVLASVGNVKPLVAQRPRVAIVANGDELVDPAAKPGPAQVRNSNTAQLRAQLEGMCADVRDYGIVRDAPADIERTLAEALRDNDVVLISAGVSVGDYDLVPQALQRNNVRLLFEKIAIQPGKPTIFGLSQQGYCFGLPGNPVSAFVVFELLVKPFLYRLMGHAYTPLRALLPLETPLSRKAADRQCWLPCQVTPEGMVRPLEYHGSAHILSLCKADGLIRMEQGVAAIDNGTCVEVCLLSTASYRGAS